MIYTANSMNESPPTNDNKPSSSSGNSSSTPNQVIHRDIMTNSDNNHKNDTLSFLTNGYDNLITILTSENKLCERKLNIFNTKRLDEENKKINFMRKIAKLKQLEEAQSLDPANFKNQKNF